MLYTVYIPKKQGESNEFCITSVIKEYLKLNQCCDGVICAPGYSSKTQNNHIEFWEKTFPEEIIKDRNFKAWVLEGMNGVATNKSFMDAVRLINHIDFINPGKNSGNDHRKMMAFFRSSHMIPENNGLDKQSFLESIEIDSVLIGSSNQSYNTYLKKPAAKGETDIMLIAANNRSTSGNAIWKFVENVSSYDLNEMDNIIGESVQAWEALLNQVRITSDIAPKEFKIDRSFLKEIAKEMVL